MYAIFKRNACCPCLRSKQAVRMAMKNQFIFYRLIKPVVSSSYFGNVFHRGSLIGMVKQYHEIPPHVIEIHDPTPISLITSNVESLDDSVRRRWIKFPYVSSFKVLRPGMLLFKNYLTLVGQVEIVNLCQKWGRGFYKPVNQSGADQLWPHMMCFGRNWDPVTKYENPNRSDGSKPPPIPDQLVSLAEYAVEDTRVHPPKLPLAHLDTCLVNFYSTSSRLGVHQDNDESSYSLSRGAPVVSISVGDSTEFLYGNTKDENKLDNVLLESGDVLVFGGESRHIFHGVKRILPHSSPAPLLQATGLRPGCLNLTLKEYEYPWVLMQ